MTKANISWSVKQVVKACENGSMVFDNAIQRGLVWDINRQSLLVDSVLRNYPIPAMFTERTNIDAPATAKKGSKVFDCFDGKQRCEALRAFRNDEFALRGLECFPDESGELTVDINGLKYSELSEEMRDTFDSYTLTVYFFTDITTDEVAEIMSRLNNGKAMTGVEQARIKAKDFKHIKELADHKLFTENLSEAAIKGYANEEIIIKLALQIYCEQFELSAKNVREGYETLIFTDDMLSEITRVLDTTYDVIVRAKEKSTKSVIRKVLKKTNLVSVLYFIYAECKHYEVEDIADFIISFFSPATTEFQTQYNTACDNGTNHSANVIARKDNLAQAFDAYAENLEAEQYDRQE